MSKLHIVIVSTRPGRQGPAIGKWFHGFAAQHGKFEAELIDLADFHLPVFDEPNHPRLKQYVHDHTKAWSASVSAADAFVFVTPEYNYGPPPSFVNALNYLSQEWRYKPAAFVSYGGVSGGTRAAQMEKLLLTTLKMVPMTEQVTLPFFNQFINDEGVFTANETHEKSAGEMLDELHRWTEALKPLRGG